MVQIQYMVLCKFTFGNSYLDFQQLSLIYLFPVICYSRGVTNTCVRFGTCWGKLKPRNETDVLHVLMPKMYLFMFVCI